MGTETVYFSNDLPFRLQQWWFYSVISEHNPKEMKSIHYIHSSLSLDEEELQKKLSDLQMEALRLKVLIKEIKESEPTYFNSLEYYEENLEIVMILIGDLQYRIGKCEKF